MYNSIRLPKELLDLQNNPIENITVEAINENDLFNWKVTIKGPNDSQYKEQIFNLNITFKNDYPFSFPDFVFITNIDHPNFHTNERISLNILQIESWTPFISIRTILLKIYSLLENPMPLLAVAPIPANNNIHHIHTHLHTDNIQRKIVFHFWKFVIAFLNDILKNLNIQERFLKNDYSLKRNISFSKIFKDLNLAEIICNDISKQYKFSRGFNREIYEDLLIQGNEVMINLLNEKCLTIFKEIYCNKKKIINLKKYGLDRQIILSKNISNFHDLLD